MVYSDGALTFVIKSESRVSCKRKKKGVAIIKLIVRHMCVRARVCMCVFVRVLFLTRRTSSERADVCVCLGGWGCVGGGVCIDECCFGVH